MEIDDEQRATILRVAKADRLTKEQTRRLIALCEMYGADHAGSFSAAIKLTAPDRKYGTTTTIKWRATP